ncbi:hypothetical protein KSP40_PGU001356 [Platanthera guangdongensis]|uniref:FRIGIDA-like protein n=1 Tax=Platanthera guangdongensis TaxID=2320717 RepID=A0ABR2M8Y9_9ASPA
MANAVDSTPMSTSSAVEAGFAKLERQRELIANCTALYKELSDHFSSVERCLELRSESVFSNRRILNISTQCKLAFLQRREESIDGSVDIAMARVEKLRRSYVYPPSTASSRKESDILRKETPLALKESIDPANFVMDAIARVFPVDRRAVKSPPGDLGWVYVLLLESLVFVLADPELGAERPLVTRIVKERAKKIAESCKLGMEQRGGVENAKAQDVHAFMQHLVTFGIGVKE